MHFAEIQSTPHVRARQGALSDAGGVVGGKFRAGCVAQKITKCMKNADHKSDSAYYLQSLFHDQDRGPC